MALAPAEAGRGFFSLTRSGSPQAAPILRVVLYSDVNIASGPVRLRAGGFDVELAGRWGDDEITASTRDPALLSGLVRALAAEDKPVEVSIGPVHLSIPTAQAAAALNWLDDRQGRSGSVTALLRKGPRPVSALTPPPEAPRFAAAPLGSASEVKPAAPPRVLLSRPEVRGCDKDQLAQEDEWGAWRLGADLTLWSIPCALDAANLRSVFLVSDARGGGVRPAPLPSIALRGAQDPTEPAFVLANADFDPKTMILNAFQKSRESGDCGLLSRFVWDGRIFQPLEIDYMPACRGVTPEAWPAIFRGDEK
jgi:hypothetical protein